MFGRCVFLTFLSPWHEAGGFSHMKNMRLPKFGIFGALGKSGNLWDLTTYSIYIHIYLTHIQHINVADVNIGYTELLVTSNLQLYWYDIIVYPTYIKTLYANSCPCSIGASWVRGDQAFSEGKSAPIRTQRSDLGGLWKWWSARTLEMWGKVGKELEKVGTGCYLKRLEQKVGFCRHSLIFEVIYN